MADGQEIGKRLKSVLDYVQDCDRRVAQGEIMDLQGLDKNVIEICDAVAALPPKDAKPLEKQMATLISKLEHLADAMRQQQQKFAAGGG